MQLKNDIKHLNDEHLVNITTINNLVNYQNNCLKTLLHVTCKKATNKTTSQTKEDFNN